MKSLKFLWVCGTIATSLALSSATPAAAQTKEQKAQARAAADAAGDAFDAGKWAEAADLFERAERLVHAPPHLLFAARAHAKLGELVQARELYLTLTREQLGERAPRAFRDAQQMGQKELPDIEERLPYISLVVQGAGQGPIRVTRNGEPIPSELLGIPTPINPGDYSFQAFSDGMESTPTTVKLAERAKETVVLTLHAVPGAGEQPSGPAGAASSQGATLADGSPASDTASSSGRPFLFASLGSFALGAAGIAVGSVFLVQRSDSNTRADEIFDSCNPTASCTDEQIGRVRDLESEGRSHGTVAIASFVLAGLGVAGGVTFLVLDGQRERSASVQLTPVVGLNYAGLAGRF